MSNSGVPKPSHERRRRLSLDTNLYPAGRGLRLPPSPTSGFSNARISSAPFNSPFSPRLTPGEKARRFLDHAANGQLLDIVAEGANESAEARSPTKRSRRGSLDDLSRVLGKYTRAKQHLFDTIRVIKKQEDQLDNKLEDNLRRLTVSDNKYQKAAEHSQKARRNSFQDGTDACKHLNALQSMKGYYVGQDHARDEEESKRAYVVEEKVAEVQPERDTAEEKEQYTESKLDEQKDVDGDEEQESKTAMVPTTPTTKPRPTTKTPRHQVSKQASPTHVIRGSSALKLQTFNF